MKLLDGSFCSALSEQGFSANDHMLWTAGANLEAPDKVYESYKTYLKSDVDYVITNSYHCSIELIRKYNPDVNPSQLIKVSIEELTRAMQDTGKQPVVLASIGCYGTVLRDASEYHGKYVEEKGIREKMISYHRDQINEMVALGQEIILFETIPAQLEVDVILDLLPEFPKLKAVISLTCKDGSHLRHGEHFSTAGAKILAHNQVIGIGVNCTHHEFITSLFKSIDAKGKEVFAYPNSGFEGNTSFEHSSSALVTLLREWKDAGVTVAGGCCGVSPAVIKDMRKAIDIINKE